MGVGKRTDSEGIRRKGACGNEEEWTSKWSAYFRMHYGDKASVLEERNSL